MIPSLLDLLIASLCAYRLTQLAVWDDISEPVVNWVGRRSEWLDLLFGCAHCCGFWCSLFTVGITMAWKRWGWWPLQAIILTFAVAGVVSLVEHATGWLESDGYADDGDESDPNL